MVVGPHGQEVGAVLKHSPASLVANSDWEQGRTGSIQAGLREIAPDDDVLLWPVDHPFVELSTVADMLRTASSDSLTWWFIPTFHDQGGHPVLLRRELRPMIEQLGADEPLRTLAPRLGIYVRRLPVEDPGILESADSPEEYLTAVQRWRLRQEGGA